MTQTRTLAVPVWFGSIERPLFGWWHTPSDGEARGGVVMCPALGMEGICGYFSYRAIANALARVGFAVLRFDYDGTGDSFGGPSEPRRVEAWRRSVQHAVDVIIDSGAGAVALLGMRVGALLAAAEAERRGGVDALVLWDPCVSGKSYLREQSALMRMSVGDGGRDDGSIEAPGLAYSAETAAELSALDLLRMDGPLAKHCLLLEHPQRPRSQRLRRHLAGVDVVVDDAVGQGALLDPPLQSTPHETIERIASYLDATFGRARALSVTEAPGRTSAIVAGGSGMGEVTERALTLGHSGLFGIVSEPADPPIGPTIVLINEGNTPHIGQSRMWVDLGRRFGEAGLRTLRWDLSGNGDSPTRTAEQEAHVAWAPEAFDDVNDVLHEISPSDPSDVVLIGLCAGAYQALEAALEFTPRGICLISPDVRFDPPESPPDARRRARQRTKAWLTALATPPVTRIARRWNPQDPQRWVTALETAAWPAAIARRVPSIPDVVWHSVNRALLDRTTAAVLADVVAKGVEVVVVSNEEDLLPIQLGAKRTMDQLRRAPNFHLEVLAGANHSGVLADHRRLMMDTVFDHVARTFALNAAPRIEA